MAKARIQIVEDEIVVAHDLKSTVEALGYEVPAIASTAEQAVACGRELHPDLVLMDIFLNGDEDGIDAAAIFRDDLEIPVIYLTAYSDESILERAKTTEPYGYIIKPFQERELHSAIEMALFKSRAERRIAHLNRVLRAIRNVNQLIVQEKDRQVLIERACECLTETRGYHSAWITLYDETGSLSITAGSGMGTGFGTAKERLRAGQEIECLKKAKLSSQPIPVEDPLSTCTACPLVGQYGGHGGLTTRLEHEGEIFGFLIVAAPTLVVSDEEELDLMAEMALDLGLALHGIAVARQRERTEEELHLKDHAFEHSEAALWKSEEKFRALVTGSEEIVYMIAKDGTFLLSEGKGLAKLGLKPGQTVGESAFVLYKDYPEMLDSIRRAFTGETVITDAEVAGHHFRSWYTPHFDRSGEVAGLLGLSINTTEEKRAKEKLQESQEKLRLVIDQSPLGVCTVDHRGYFTEANPAYERTTGYSLEELHKLTIFDITHPDDRPSNRNLFQNMSSGKTSGFKMEKRYIRKNGAVIFVAIHAEAIRDAAGEPLFGLALVEDITERKQTEEALAKSQAALIESKQQMETALEGADLGTWDWNIETGELHCNDRWARMKGYRPEEIEPGLDFFRNLVHPDDLQATDERMNAHLKGETERYASEFRIRDKSGEWIWIQDRGKVIERDVNGSPLRAGGTHQDITAQRRIEREKTELEAKLLHQQRLEAIGTLASGVAHEINNPINGVINYAQLILDESGDDSRTGGYAREIINETERVATIVRHLLAFSRQDKQSHSPALISDIAEATLSLVRTIIRHDQISLVVDVPETLPQLKCRSQQIQQVLMNLLTNARDALNERYPEYDDDKVLSVTASESQHDDRRWIRITIEDHGTGIAPENKKRIFEPFFTTKGRDKGTGLGLAIAHGIVSEHHGELRVDSEPGRGTTVILELPVENGWSLDGGTATQLEQGGE
jgi:PAS domain S-box-containing protein